MKNLYILILFQFFYLTNSVFAQDFWEIIDLPVGIGTFDAKTNSNNDLIIGTNRGILCRKQYETTWDTLLYLNNEAIGALFIDETGNIFGAGRHLFYSDDNGENWIQLFESPELGLTSIFRNSEGSIFIGHWGGIYKCDTLGSGFIPVLSFNNSEVVNSIVEDTISGEMYCGTINFFAGGGIYRSTDGGNNWVQDGLTGHFVSSLAFNSNGDLFAGTRGGDFGIGGVFKMLHSQNEWVQVNNQELVTSIVINSQDEIFVGCSFLDGYTGGVRYSANNGITWEIVNSGMGNKDIEELSISATKHLYAIAYNSDDQLFMSIEPTVTNVEISQSENTNLVFNYPNPFIGETNICFSLPFGINNTFALSIYNSGGIKVREQWINRNYREVQRFKFNAGKLDSGIYYYTVTYENTHLNGKMIILNN